MSDLRLIPYPQEVTLQPGRFPAGGGLRIRLADPGDRFAAEQLAEEAALWGMDGAIDAPLSPRDLHALAVNAGDPAAVDAATVPEATEGYFLQIDPGGAVILSRGAAGLFYGVQTLKQLLRANRGVDGSLPCVTIRDWPDLAWRGFQDDMTRGPSSRLETLKEEVRIAAEFKMNFFSYYMEYQFEYPGHPLIGPPDGSLTRDELRELVAFAKPYHVRIVGNQQCFGHMEHILKHDAYKPLAENPRVLSPVFDETYQLIGDLFDAQVDLVECDLFNINCDETWGLGEGPSKAWAEKDGVGVVYAEHLRRIHGLLAERGKRMMMWGDIILQHPEELHRIPKDTVMLSWGYDPRDSFEDQILPFRDAGYDFIVCPGTNGWRRLYPDFEAAVINIRNFIRDGAAHGAMGALVTTWRDTANNLTHWDWHGVVWGAENAWRPGRADLNRFNRAFGAVFFGEPGDAAGRLVELLTEVRRRGYPMRDLDQYTPRDGLLVSRRAESDRARIARDRLAEAEAAAAELRAQAVLRPLAVDAFALMVRLAQSIPIQTLSLLHADELAREGYRSGDRTRLDLAASVIEVLAADGEALKNEYSSVYLRENRPYALDWTTDRVDQLITHYRAIAQTLHDAAAALENGEQPDPGAIWRLPLHGERITDPVRVDPPRTAADAAADAPADGITLAVGAGPVDRIDLPVEVNLGGVLGDRRLEPGSVRMDWLNAGSGERELSGQILRDGQTLYFLIPSLPAGATAALQLTPASSAATRPAITVSEGAGGLIVNNGAMELVIGSRGGHLFRWSIEGVDLTAPGDEDWCGFADAGNGDARSEMGNLEILEAGPLMARIDYRSPSGFHRTFTIVAGRPWVEILAGVRPPWQWHYDNPALLGWESETPVRYGFSNGNTGEVPAGAAHQQWQHSQGSVHWAAKVRADGLALALILPNEALNLTVGAGGAWGGVGVEHPPAPAHAVLYGGLVDAVDFARTFDAVRRTHDFLNPPRVTIAAMEVR